MNRYDCLNIDVDDKGVALVGLNRPDAHNALDPALIAELTTAADELATNDNVRMIVLTGVGESFCAGGDLKWMRSNFDKTRRERVEESASLATLLARLDNIPKLVIGRINGPAYGGGLGLIAVCDIAISAQSARFCLTETTLGLTPANISPYVVARIGSANARYTFLNARPLSADDAREIGLIHQVVADELLDEAIDREIRYALRTAPGAVKATKELIRFVSTHDAATNTGYTADRLADAWESEEGQLGVRAFFAKTKPSWRR